MNKILRHSLIILGVINVVIFVHCCDHVESERLLPQGIIELHNKTSHLFWYKLCSIANGKVNENNIKLEKTIIDIEGFLNPDSKTQARGFVLTFKMLDGRQVPISLWGHAISLFLRKNKENNIQTAKSDDELKIIFEKQEAPIIFHKTGTYRIRENENTFIIEEITV